MCYFKKQKLTFNKKILNIQINNGVFEELKCGKLSIAVQNIHKIISIIEAYTRFIDKVS